MTFSWKRIGAIVQKGLRDFFRNAQVLAMVFMPIVFAFVFSKIPVSPHEESESTVIVLLAMPILMALTMTGAFVQAMIIAEEKEKHTLRTLMLTPATSAEVLFGKSFISTVLTFVTIVVCVIASGQSISAPLLFFTITVINIILFVALGTVMGLLSKSLQETSVIGLPVMFIFLMGPMFAPMIDINWLMTIVSYLPTHHFMEGVESLHQGGGLSDIGGNLLNMSIWVVVVIVLSLFVYRKRRFDG